MTNHTPAPWKVDAMGNIWGKDTKVAEMSTQPSQADFLYRRESTEEHEANAEYIVKCVNYHDRLAEALGWALEWIDSIPSDVDLPAMPGFDRDYVNSLMDELSAHNGEER